MTFPSARKIPAAKAKARNGRRIGFAAALLLLSCESLQTAIADGETRTISMQHTHRDDSITVTFKRNGRYDEAALKKLNWFLRDWRSDEQITMDPQLFDLVWEVQHEFGGNKTIHIVSSYRSPQTNAMLRRRSGGVARFSQHMLGKAMDFFIPGVSLADLRVAGLRLQRGGVGFYPASGSPFVHLDVGSVRHWPRMTREQLVKVFPDGRTVHVPTDGQPLPGYALARADLDRRGDSPSATTLAAAREDGALKPAKPNLIAKLFGFGKDKDEDDDSDVTASTRKAAPAVLASRAAPPAAEPQAGKNITAKSVAITAGRLPVPRPSTFIVASVPAATAAKPAEKPASALAPKTPVQTASAVPASANDVIARRGYWQGLPETQPAPATVRVAARTPVAAPVTPIAASLSPFPDAPSAGGANGAQLTLAYAADPRREPARAAPMGATVAARAAPGVSAASVAIKQNGRPAIVKPVPAQAAAVAATAKSNANQGYDQPWLRAIMLTPSVHHFLTATLLGAADFRAMRPLFAKPSSAVAMGFSGDPQPGVITTAFSGKAVIFTATVLFGNRTASLQQ